MQVPSPKNVATEEIAPLQANLSRKGYHHGDLRAALMVVGLRVLEAGSVDSFSLREVAREIGVSVGAIYRHFPDKSAMLQALASQGLVRLGEAQMRAAQEAGPGMAGFTAAGRTYVRFALAHPTLFRVIMSYAMMIDTASMSRESPSLSMRLLMESVAGLLPKASEKELRLAALRAWSEVHGLTMLMLEKQIPQDDALIDAVVDAPSYGWNL